MRKILILAALTAVAVGGFILGYKIYQVIHKKQLIARNIVTLPAFSFYKLDKTVFNFDSVATYKDRLIVMFFNPDCAHCQYMAKNYVKHKAELDSCKILMVTLADSLSAAKFYTGYGLSNLPNAVILLDPKANFPKTFGVGVVPSFLVYKDSKLINRFIGETKIDNLLSDSTLIIQ